MQEGLTPLHVRAAGDRPAALPKRTRNAHLIGQPGGRADLETPALLVEIRPFTRNIARMAKVAAARRLALRPHVKTHKSVEIARRQIAAGAIGVSCVTLREAETMIDGGIGGVLLTAPLVTRTAIARLVGLAHVAGPGNLMVVVDHADQADALSGAASLADRLDVLVDFNSGYHRTGTTSETDAIHLARHIVGLPHLALRGLQAYAGNIQHIVDRAARVARAAELRACIETILEGADAEGIALPIVTGAGTGTHDIDAAPFTESQPGSYVFNDAQYAPVLADGVVESPFETSLFVQSTVISANAPGFVTLDAGVKSLATDGPLPLVVRGADPEATYAFFGDEYGKLFCPGPRPALGAKVELVTPHCDPTVNLYDEIHVVDGDRLEAIWPVDARGH